MNWLAILCFFFLNSEAAFAEQWHREAMVLNHEHLYSRSNNKTGIKVSSIAECSHKCFYAGSSCVGANFQTVKIKGKHSCELAYQDEQEEKLFEKTDWIYLQPIEKKRKILEVRVAVSIKLSSFPLCNG